MSREAILTVNTGSSSIKLAGYEVESARAGRRVLKATLSGLPERREFSATIDDRAVEHLPKPLQAAGDEKGDLVAALAEWAAEALGDRDIRGVGHRVVHGGRDFTGPVRADAEVVEELRKLSVLAPSHQPDNLAGVRGIEKLWPDMPQTLSFDTAFHRTQPRVAELYAIPRELSDEGLLRFGFHGLSYAHIADVLEESLAPEDCERVVVAHLGSGASLCAMQNGQSAATSMGLTALDGVPMATRSGSVDPGLVLHLIKDRGMSAQDVSELLYKQSGLLGLSGISGDVRQLLASDDPAAREALDVYAYRIAREISSLAGALQGLDVLVFTGGVGENAWQVRERICARLGWLGVSLDGTANREGRRAVHNGGSEVKTLVIPADEEAVIAREALSILSLDRDDQSFPR